MVSCPSHAAIGMLPSAYWWDHRKQLVLQGSVMLGMEGAGTESTKLALPAETLLSHVGNTGMLMPKHGGKNFLWHWWLNSAGMEKLPSFEAALKGDPVLAPGSFS